MRNAMLAMLAILPFLGSACAAQGGKGGSGKTRGVNHSPIAAPSLRPIGDAKNWQLTEPTIYRVEDSKDSVIVPVGFVTDFASIPPALQSLISALGPYVLPAVVHDYLYWNQTCTKRQADSLFYKAMSEMKVASRDRTAMYDAVYYFGNSAWQKNQQDRANGMPRIIPAGVLRAPGPLETWADYRLFLHNSGVRPETPEPIEKKFCAHGGPA